MSIHHFFNMAPEMFVYSGEHADKKRAEWLENLSPRALLLYNTRKQEIVKELSVFKHPTGLSNMHERRLLEGDEEAADTPDVSGVTEGTADRDADAAASESPSEEIEEEPDVLLEIPAPAPSSRLRPTVDTHTEPKSRLILRSVTSRR